MTNFILNRGVEGREREKKSERKRVRERIFLL